MLLSIRSRQRKSERKWVLSDTHRRSIAKAVSWRVTGTLDTFIISWLITGQLTLAGAIAFTEVITKIILYWIHERAWNKVSWGRIRE
jgi:uncharacterized membrane protein